MKFLSIEHIITLRWPPRWPPSAAAGQPTTLQLRGSQVVSICKLLEPAATGRSLDWLQAARLTTLADGASAPGGRPCCGGSSSTALPSGAQGTATAGPKARHARRGRGGRRPDSRRRASEAASVPAQARGGGDLGASSAAPSAFPKLKPTRPTLPSRKRDNGRPRRRAAPAAAPQATPAGALTRPSRGPG
jgi:hypothetical protein